MRKCKNCGSNVKEGATLCNNCGQRLEPDVSNSEISNKPVSPPIATVEPGNDTESYTSVGTSDQQKKAKYLFAAICFVSAIIICPIIWLGVAIHQAEEQRTVEINTLLDIKTHSLKELERKKIAAEEARAAQLEALRQEALRKEEQKQKAFNQMIAILKNTKNRYSDQLYDDEDASEFINKSRYFTTDYNQDDIPELWIVGPNGLLAEAAPYEVFIMQPNGNVAKIADYAIDGDFKIKNDVIYGVGWEGTDADAGWYVIKFTISGNKFKHTIVDEGESYESNRYDKYYAYPKPVQSPLSDYSLLRRSFNLDNPNIN